MDLRTFTWMQRGFQCAFTRSYFELGPSYVDSHGFTGPAQAYSQAQPRRNPTGPARGTVTPRSPSAPQPHHASTTQRATGYSPGATRRTYISRLHQTWPPPAYQQHRHQPPVIAPCWGRGCRPARHLWPPRRWVRMESRSFHHAHQQQPRQATAPAQHRTGCHTTLNILRHL